MHTYVHRIHFLSRIKNYLRFSTSEKVGPDHFSVLFRVTVTVQDQLHTYLRLIKHESDLDLEVQHKLLPNG
jgi:hypothetical protein